MFKKSFASLLCFGLVFSLICVSLSSCSSSPNDVPNQTENITSVQESTEVKQHSALVINKNHYYKSSKYGGHHVYELELEVDNGELYCFANVKDKEHYLKVKEGDVIVFYERIALEGIEYYSQDYSVTFYN